MHRTGYSTYYQTEDVTDSAIPALQTGKEEKSQAGWGEHVHCDCDVVVLEWNISVEM